MILYSQNNIRTIEDYNRWLFNQKFSHKLKQEAAAKVLKHFDGKGSFTLKVSEDMFKK